MCGVVFAIASLVGVEAVRRSENGEGDSIASFSANSAAATA